MQTNTNNLNSKNRKSTTISKENQENHHQNGTMNQISSSLLEGSARDTSSSQPDGGKGGGGGTEPVTPHRDASEKEEEEDIENQSMRPPEQPSLTIDSRSTRSHKPHLHHFSSPSHRSQKNNSHDIRSKSFSEAILDYLSTKMNQIVPEEDAAMHELAILQEGGVFTDDLPALSNSPQLMIDHPQENEECSPSLSSLPPEDPHNNGGFLLPG